MFILTLKLNKYFKNGEHIYCKTFFFTLKINNIFSYLFIIFYFKICTFNSKKVNRTVQEAPEAEAAAKPPTPGGREKVTQINVCIANKQMHDKHKDQLPLLFPKQGDQNAKRTEKYIDKEQVKTKHEAPRSVNYGATQNKNNIGTTALERSVVYPGSRDNS